MDPLAANSHSASVGNRAFCSCRNVSTVAKKTPTFSSAQQLPFFAYSPAAVLVCVTKGYMYNRVISTWRRLNVAVYTLWSPPVSTFPVWCSSSSSTCHNQSLQWQVQHPLCACVVLSLHWQPPRHLSYSLCDASFDTFRQLVFVDE